MSLDPSILARIQFAFTLSFHIIFPTMSIGLVYFLATSGGLPVAKMTSMKSLGQ
jgi:cytochrome d ubiquinol oxidase subunit I